MIRISTPFDIPEMKAIWDANFKDPMNYIDFVFDEIAAPEDVLVDEQDGRVVSMVVMIPVDFVYNNEAVKTLYVFGAATDRKYQNRGIMTRMLLGAEDTARKKGARLSVLVPGERYLFEYYRKRGYRTDFSLKSIAIKPGMLDSASDVREAMRVDSLGAEEMFSVRENALKKIPHIAWSKDQLEFVIKDSRIYGDHTAAYSGIHGEAYAFYSLRGRKLSIKECLGTTGDAELALINSVILASSAGSAVVNLPQQSTIFGAEGELHPYGMSKPLTIHNSLRDMDPYMNLMLD